MVEGDVIIDGLVQEQKLPSARAPLLQLWSSEGPAVDRNSLAHRRNRPVRNAHPWKVTHTIHRTPFMQDQICTARLS
jgi:hypothetical protein